MILLFRMRTGGNGADVGRIRIDPACGVSRERCMGATNFAIDLPLTGTAGIECRTGGVNGDHQVIVTFPTPVTVSGCQRHKWYRKCEQLQCQRRASNC